MVLLNKTENVRCSCFKSSDSLSLRKIFEVFLLLHITAETLD